MEVTGKNISRLMGPLLAVLILITNSYGSSYVELELSVNAVGEDSNSFHEGGPDVNYVSGSVFAEATRLDGNGYGRAAAEGWADSLNVMVGFSYAGYAEGYNPYQGIRSGEYIMRGKVRAMVTVGPGGGFEANDPVQFVLYLHASGQFHGDGDSWDPSSIFEVTVSDGLGQELHNVREIHNEVEYGLTVPVVDNWSSVVETTVGSTETFELFLDVSDPVGYGYGGSYPASGYHWADFSNTSWIRVGCAPGYEGLNLTGIPMICKADFNLDTGVDFKDFAILAVAWQADNNDSNWNPDCDISNPPDSIIDMNDLKVFCDGWLCGK